MSSSSSVLHRLQSHAPRSKNRKERKKELALSKYAPLVKYVVDRLALHLPKSVERDDLVSAAMQAIVRIDAVVAPDSGEQLRHAVTRALPPGWRASRSRAALSGSAGAR